MGSSQIRDWTCIPCIRAWQPTPVFLPGESPMDRGVWWATVHRVAKSWMWLKQMSTHTSLHQQGFLTRFFTIEPPGKPQPLITFLLLLTSAYKILSFCTAPRSSFLSVRLDAARFMNHKIKPIKPLKFTQFNFVFLNSSQIFSISCYPSKRAELWLP